MQHLQTCKAWFFAVTKPPFLESYSQLKNSSWFADFPTTCGAGEHSRPLRAAIRHTASSQLFSAVRRSKHQHPQMTCSQHWKHLLQIMAITTYFRKSFFVSKGKHSPPIGLDILQILTDAPVSASRVICSCMSQHFLTLAPMAHVSGNSDFICASMTHTETQVILRYSETHSRPSANVEPCFNRSAPLKSCSKFLRCA